MRLQKKQREALISWIADGAQSDEIRTRAAAFEPPFSITRSLVEYYRTRDKVKVAEIIEADQKNALNTGLALKDERVKKLKELAEKMGAEILGDRLWVPDVKSIGSGPSSEKIDFEYFNKAEVDAYLKTLDDIAAEVGGRVNKNETITKEIDYTIFDIDELTRITNGESETAVYADALKRIAASQSKGRA
jgi:hypothetical protein